jgi:hypothetical protein
MFRRILLLTSAILALAATDASATFTVTYTGDNVVSSWFQNGGAPVAQSPGPNATNWRLADTSTLSLGVGDYQIIFRVNNLGGPSEGNPAGFLAEVTGSGISGDLTTSIDWEYSLTAPSAADPTNFDALTWTAATSYGNNGGSNIWTSVHGGPISGISTSAEWIWSENNFNDPYTDGEMYLRGHFRVVPEPTSVSVIGLGLLGFGWVMRRKRA